MLKLGLGVVNGSLWCASSHDVDERMMCQLSWCWWADEMTDCTWRCDVMCMLLWCLKKLLQTSVLKLQMDRLCCAWNLDVMSELSSWFISDKCIMCVAQCKWIVVGRHTAPRCVLVTYLCSCLKLFCEAATATCCRKCWNLPNEPGIGSQTGWSYTM